MDEELKKRFIKQKIQDFLADDLKPFPTIICEMERPDILELVRKYCMFSTKMVLFTFKHFQPTINEGLDIQHRRVDFGELYIDVSVN